MKVHEAIARTLTDLGVTTVFGVIGDANLYLIDSFQRHAGGRYVPLANEAGAVLAATGYASVTGAVGVATVTHGPGLTNTVTALAEGVRAGAPVVLIAGDTPVLDRENLQDIAQREVVRASGAGFEQVRSPQTATADLAVALRRAVLEGRPVVLNVPVEYQHLDVDHQPAHQRWVPPQAVAPSSEAMDAAVGVVASARRPVVLAGRGATSPLARSSLLKLARRIGAPLATTLRAKDLFRGEAHDLGLFGSLSHEPAQDVIASSDCILVFGASLNSRTTADGGLLAGKSVLQVDLDPRRLDRSTSATTCVLGDAATVADEIRGWLDEAEIPATSFASPALAERLAQRPPPTRASDVAEGTVDMREALEIVDAGVAADRILVIDGGRFIYDAFTMLHVEDPSSYVHTLSFGSIGLAVANAVGAAHGAPGRPVLTVCGDGGFMLGGLAEFNTAVREGLDLVVIVLNDGAYGAEYIQFERMGLDPRISTVTWPDLASVATALGGVGRTARSADELRSHVGVLRDLDRPVLIDVKIDPESVLSGR